METLKLRFSGSIEPVEFTVEHDPEETGISVIDEFHRMNDLAELGGFHTRSPKAEDFRNFLWSELGLKSSF
jgi:hypothetical protein